MSNHTASDIARADDQPTPQPMTGTALRRFRQEVPHSLSDLAKRWGCSKQNVQKKEQMDEVTQIYADAMRTLVREHRDSGAF